MDYKQLREFFEVCRQADIWNVRIVILFAGIYLLYLIRKKKIEKNLISLSLQSCEYGHGYEVGGDMVVMRLRDFDMWDFHFPQLFLSERKYSDIEPYIEESREIFRICSSEEEFLRSFGINLNNPGPVIIHFQSLGRYLSAEELEEADVFSYLDTAECGEAFLSSMFEGFKCE